MIQPVEPRRANQASISRDPNMNLALLLDLDNTLLDSSMDTFLPAYFQALSDFLRERVEPELMVSALISGTRKMAANTDPALTLQQIFDADFFPKVGLA